MVACVAGELPSAKEVYLGVGTCLRQVAAVPAFVAPEEEEGLVL